MFDVHELERGCYWIVTPSDEVREKIGYTKSSYGMIACRLMGLSPVQYAIYCFKNYNAEINVSGYVSQRFPDKESAESAARELTERWKDVFGDD